MAHRLQLVCIVAVSVLTSAGLALGQSMGSTGVSFSSGLVRGSYQSLVTVPTFFDGGFANAYAYPGGQSDAQQNGNGSQSQSQNGNQSMNGSQSQNQGKQGQGKEEAPPPQPQYLTYTPKKQSLEEQAKSGKAEAVDFKSSPAGAEVTVDGYFVGRTPTSAQIPFGKHLISISKWGYELYIQEIDVTGKGSVNIDPKLNEDW